MVKAYFLDYTGTMVQEDEPYTRELLSYFSSHSNVRDSREILRIVWGMIKEIEADCYGSSFLKNDEKIDRILTAWIKDYGLQGDLQYIHEVWRKVWVYAPLYDDVKPFFVRSKLPIYILSNDDLCYLEESMKLKGLHPAGIISAEMVKACKPSRVIFEKALEAANAKPDEVIHIGDSVISDVIPAQQMGIIPIYIARSGKSEIEGVRVIKSLDEIG